MCLQTCFCTSTHPQGYFSLLSTQEQIVAHGWILACDTKRKEYTDGQMEQLYHYYVKWQVYSGDETFGSFFPYRGGVNLDSGSLLHMCVSLARCLKVQTIVVARPLFSCSVRRLTKTNECKSMHASDQRLLLCGVTRGASQESTPPSLPKPQTDITVYQLSCWWLLKCCNYSWE